jgi:hypothetical protein
MPVTLKEPRIRYTAARLLLPIPNPDTSSDSAYALQTFERNA